MNSQIKRKASKLANQLHTEYDIDTDTLIPVEDLAQEIGINISRRRLLKDIEGEANIDDGDMEIILDSNSHRYRERFTIAHEIGHLLIDNSVCVGTRQVDLPTYSAREMEDFCNKFASRLLVPDDAIQDLSKWHNMTIDAVSKRGRELQVSLETIMRRVLEMAKGDGGFLLFNRKEGVNVERPFVLERGIFPSSNTYSARSGDSNLVIPYRSKHFTQLVEIYNSDREYLFKDLSLNLDQFPGKNSIRTAVRAMSHNDQLVLVVIPPKVDISKITNEDESSISSHARDMSNIE